MFPDVLAAMPLGRMYPYDAELAHRKKWHVPDFGPLCAECGKWYTPDEWEARHSNFNGDDIHESCCEKVGPCSTQEVHVSTTTIDYDDPFTDLEVSEEKPAPPQIIPPTERQVGYALSLLFDREVRADYELSVRKQIDSNTISKSELSAVIDHLKSLPKRTETSYEPPEGIHKLGETIYKVQEAKHGSGLLYAKRFDPYPTHDRAGKQAGEWIYIGRNGAFYKLDEATKLTLEEAKAWGHLYGICCRCGAWLTDETSIANGIGPICAEKGWG